MLFSNLLYLFRLHTGWNSHWYDVKTLSCLWKRVGTRSYVIFFVTTCIMLPCAAILYFYTRIFYFAFKSKARLHNANVRESLRIAKGLFAAFFLFSLCWVPFGFIVLTDYQDRLPRGTVMFTMTIAHLNSAFNPILYAISNTNFRTGYANMLRKIVGRQNAEHAFNIHAISVVKTRN